MTEENNNGQTPQNQQPLYPQQPAQQPLSPEQLAQQAQYAQQQAQFQQQAQPAQQVPQQFPQQPAQQQPQPQYQQPQQQYQQPVPQQVPAQQYPQQPQYPQQVPQQFQQQPAQPFPQQQQFAQQAPQQPLQQAPVQKPVQQETQNEEQGDKPAKVRHKKAGSGDGNGGGENDEEEIKLDTSMLKTVIITALFGGLALAAAFPISKWIKSMNSSPITADSEISSKFKTDQAAQEDPFAPLDKSAGDKPSIDDIMAAKEGLPGAVRRDSPIELKYEDSYYGEEEEEDEEEKETPEQRAENERLYKLGNDPALTSKEIDKLTQGNKVKDLIVLFNNDYFVQGFLDRKTTMALTSNPDTFRLFLITDAKVGRFLNDKSVKLLTSKNSIMQALLKTKLAKELLATRSGVAVRRNMHVYEQALLRNEPKAANRITQEMRIMLATTELEDSEN